MASLVLVHVKVLDVDGEVMSGFPIIRGPKNGRMAPEAYTDQEGILSFLASPNRDIELKFLSLNDQFELGYDCRSSQSTTQHRVQLDLQRVQYRATTQLRWLSQYSQSLIPHSSFQMKSPRGVGVINTATGEAEIQSIIGEPIELRYLYPDGDTVSEPIIYSATRLDPQPLSIEVDLLLNQADTDVEQPTTPDQVDMSTVDCTAKFHKISKIVLAHEGGYVNDPQDSGGATNKGIAWQTWMAYAQSDLGLAPTRANLQAISDDQAEIIYRKRYWEPKGFCQIADDRVGLMVYDWTITSGGAAKEVQKLLINQYQQSIALDGAMGIKTIQALNAVADQQALLNAITKLRQLYYTALAFRANGEKSKNYKFLKGWLNRVNDCLTVAL
ncbi:putative peptidoglycan binding protein [Acinetobacter calcoaceticus]|uniref:Putative peptidoglycan binding protein n=1 Tax=Acinetobacter calcoaceticus TaxID=471 RepID=A0A4R1XX74_ACICA|nr:putative peptidoglycan binding protein [Acinetobacter calcoaceticus]